MCFNSNSVLILIVDMTVILKTFVIILVTGITKAAVQPMTMQSEITTVEECAHFIMLNQLAVMEINNMAAVIAICICLIC